MTATTLSTAQREQLKNKLKASECDDEIGELLTGMLLSELENSPSRSSLKESLQEFAGLIENLDLDQFVSWIFDVLLAAPKPLSSSQTLTQAATASDAAPSSSSSTAASATSSSAPALPAKTISLESSRRYAPALEAALNRPLGAGRGTSDPSKRSAAAPKRDSPLATTAQKSSAAASSSRDESSQRTAPASKKPRPESLQEDDSSSSAAEASSDRPLKKQRTVATSQSEEAGQDTSTIPCSHFPYCTFGQNCRFLHPPCKYQQFCTRPDCPFSHSAVSSGAPFCRNGFACPMRTRGCSFQHPLTACRYAAACTRKATCNFSHETVCQFGLACTRPNCRYAHAIKPAGAAPLKSLVVEPEPEPEPAQGDAAKQVDSDAAELSETLPPTP